MQYTNKYFFLEDMQYKIIRSTEKTILYKSCMIDKKMKVKNFNSRSTQFYHYSNQIDQDQEEKRMLKLTFINNGYQLIDNLNLDLYYISQPGYLTQTKSGYFNSLFFLDPNRLKSIHKFQCHLHSYIIRTETIKLYANKTSEIDVITRNNLIVSLTETKQHIFQEMISNDGSIVDKLLNYNNHLNPDEVHQIIDSIKKELTPKIEIETDCPICLEVKICEIGHFKCKHHLCPDCYKLLNKKFCCLCRST